MNNAHEPLRAYAHAIAMSLLGCLEIHDAGAELVDHLAEEFERVTREHLRCRPECRVRGKLALERLLDELKAGEATEAATH